MATKNKTTATRIGVKIRDARKAKGWTQIEFAKKIGKLQSQVSEWENADYEPQLDTLILIARNLDMDIGQLLSR